jgi:hypothetical protein
MKRVSFGSKPATATTSGSADDWVHARERSVEPVKRLTIDIPESLHRRAKTACAMENLVMADVVREMLEKRFSPAKRLADDTQVQKAADTETQKHDAP